MSETKEKLAFYLKGKTYTYEGLRSNRTKDLLNLFGKMKMETEHLVSAYRENCPQESVGTSDAEIFAQYEAVQQARKDKAARKKSITPGEMTDHNIPAHPAAAVPQPTPTGATPTGSTPGSKPPRVDGSIPVSLSPISPAPTADTSTRQMPPTVRQVSAQEKASLNEYIASLCHDSPMLDHSAHSRTDSGAGIPTRDDPDAVDAKVFLCFEGSDMQKVISVPFNRTFAELCGQIEKKFNFVPRLSFVSDGDRIEVDDNESLRMFLDQKNEGVKRLKLLCTRSENLASDESVSLQQTPSGTYQVAFGGAPQTPNKQTTPGGSAVAPAAAATAATAASSNAGDSPDNMKGAHHEQRTFSGHTEAVYCCAFAPSGDRFVTCSKDRSVRVWSTQDIGNQKLMKGGHNHSVLSCDFSPSGTHVVTSSEHGTLKIWDVVSGQMVFNLKGHSDKTWGTAYNNTGTFIVSCSSDSTVRVWSADTGKQLNVLRGHNVPVFACCFSHADGGAHVASGGDDKFVKIWSWRNSSEQKTLSGHTSTVWSCRFSHDDRCVVSGAMDHEVRLWETSSGNCLNVLRGHKSPVHFAMFAKDSTRVVSCSRDATIKVWDTEQGECIRTLHGHQSTVYHCDVHEDKIITCSLDTTLKLWSMSS